MSRHGLHLFLDADFSLTISLTFEIEPLMHNYRILNNKSLRTYAQGLSAL